MSVSSPPGVSSTASSSNEFDLPGTNYEVIRLLGAGGMGRVDEVEHRLLGSRWAAKVLAHELGYRQDLVRRLVPGTPAAPPSACVTCAGAAAPGPSPRPRRWGSAGKRPTGPLFGWASDVWGSGLAHRGFEAMV
ncbi:MAG: hypothetical protein MUF34_38200 [Polyangiaceae bacterium]|nr:hypothetical protein [Polyangiaceae bacterium]